MKSILDYAPGLHPDVPQDVYHQRVLGMVSNSALTEMARSPLHYKAWVDSAQDADDTPSFAFGRAFHCALLEPDRFAQTFVVEPDFGDCRKKENKATRDAWRAENAGKATLSTDDEARIRGMVKAVHAHRLAGKMIRDGQPELTALWQDQETGLRCRCRADYYVGKLGMMLDVKSTEDASAEAFRRSLFNYRYHWQAALYQSGFRGVGEVVKHFVFVAVEKRSPFAVATYTLDLRALELGQAAIRKHVTKLAACMQADDWPGYSGGLQLIDTPSWAA